MNVLAVVPDQTQVAALEDRFSKRLGDDLSFRRSTSGKQVLKLLKLPTDLIICARETSDIAGLEVLKAVRKERDTPFILLDRSVLSRFSPGAFDAVLDTQAHPADVLEAAFSLLVSSGRLEDARRQPPAPSRGRSSRDAKVSGTLEVVSLFDLVLLLTQKGSIGKLYLLLGQVEAMFAFQGGALVHAEYSELTGEAAVMKIFWKAELRPDAEFFFEPSPHKLPPGGVTVHSSVQEILLKVAVGLDRQREPAADH